MWHRLFGVGRRGTDYGVREILIIVQHCVWIGAACAKILHKVQHCGSIGATWAKILHERQQSSSR